MVVERARRHYLWPIAAALVAAMLLISGCMWGVVKDANTGAAVPGATVKVTDSYGVTHTATTNASGLYAFDQAAGPVPAMGPVTIEVSAPGYSSMTVPRLAQYNDNPGATTSDLSTFWEVQHFDLMPIAAPTVTADVAVTDLYPDNQPSGTLWARITNHGPDTLTNAAVQLSCQVERIDTATCSKTTLGPVTVPVPVSLSPGQTWPFNTAIGLDTAKHWYDANCTVQVSFNDPNPANNPYSEVIPPPTGDLELQDILITTKNEIGLRVSASGSLPSTFCWLVQATSWGHANCMNSVPTGSQVFWTGDYVFGTETIQASVDGGNCIPETNEANNDMTKTCSAASHTCWSSGGGSILGAGTP